MNYSSVSQLIHVQPIQMITKCSFAVLRPFREPKGFVMECKTLTQLQDALNSA